MRSRKVCAWSLHRTQYIETESSGSSSVAFFFFFFFNLVCFIGLDFELENNNMLWMAYDVAHTVLFVVLSALSKK